MNRLLLTIITLCVCLAPAMARKQSTISRGLRPSSTTTAAQTNRQAATDTIDATRLHAIALSGYDKPINANRETFFVTNGTDRTLVGLTITLTYHDMSGRLLHKATHTINCDIPAGETRAASVTTWDRQHSFYYHKGTAPRRRSTPYSVSHAIDRAVVASATSDLTIKDHETRTAD